MQLTNGAIKSGAKPNPMAALRSKLSAHQEENPEGAEMDLDSFDLGALVFTSIKTAPKVNAKEEQAVAKFLAESAELLELGSQYEIDFVSRGNQALYELLGSIYGLAERIEEHEHSKKITAAIVNDLEKNHSIKISAKSTPISAVLRYAIRTDKTTLSRYNKVLDVAKAEGKLAADIPEYIARRGGVANIRDTEANQMAASSGDKSSKERLDLIREYFQLRAKASKESFEFNGSVVAHVEEKEGDKEKAKSSFCIFLAAQAGEGEYSIVSANDLGKNYEDNLVRYLGKNFPSDLNVLEHGLRNYKRQLSMDESMPVGLRKEMQKQLALPAKHRPTAVIDAEAIELSSEEE
jgi:hypothetical protein